MRSGYRKSEPITTTPPLPELGQPRYISGGNHRSAGKRDSGKVLIPSYVVSEKSFMQMMILLEEEDISAGIIRTPESRPRDLQRCLQLLMIATQIREPSPRPATVLQMVSMMWAVVRNDPGQNIRHLHTRGVYGGMRYVRAKMFGNTPLMTDSSVHFLLNGEYARRYTKKCLSGAKVLIEAKLLRKVPALKERQTTLDLLLFWERKGWMLPFKIANLVTAGELGKETVASKVDIALSDVYRQIDNSCASICLAYNPFAKKRHVTEKAGVGTAQQDIGPVDEAETSAAQIISIIADGDENSRSTTGNEEGGCLTSKAGTSEPQLPGNIDGNKDVVLRRSERKRKQIQSYAGASLPETKRKKYSPKETSKGTVEDDLSEEGDRSDDKLEDGDSDVDRTIAELTKQLLEAQEALKNQSAYDDMRLTAAKKREEGMEDELSKLKAQLREQVTSASVIAKTATVAAATNINENHKKEMKMLKEENERALHAAEARYEEQLRKAKQGEEKAMATMRDGLENQIEKEVSARVERALHQTRQENEKLRKEHDERRNESASIADEVLSLKQKIEELEKQKELPNDNFSAELRLLRKENMELKARITETSPPETSRPRRLATPSDKMMNAMSTKQLESFLNRANRILESKKGK